MSFVIALSIAVGWFLLNQLVPCREVLLYRRNMRRYHALSERQVRMLVERGVVRRVR